MKYVYCLIIVFVLEISIIGQDYKPPLPNVKIDSVISSIQLLEIYRRANVELSFNIIFEIDSTGVASEIKFTPFIKKELSDSDQKFITQLKSNLKDIKWTPALFNNEAFSSTYRIPFIFFLKNDESILDTYYGKKIKNISQTSVDNYDYYSPIVMIKKSLFQTWHISY